MQPVADERDKDGEMNGYFRGLGVMAINALTLSAPAEAQTNLNAPDLSFPKEANELSLFSPLAMGVWKPEGNGPFPAVIILHSCGGVKGQIGHWRKEAIKRGYVAFVVDSFSSQARPPADRWRPSRWTVA